MRRTRMLPARTWVALGLISSLGLALAAESADGRPPPRCDEEDEGCGHEPQRPPIEWSTWVRVGYGVLPVFPDDVAARMVEPPPVIGRRFGWQAGLGAEVSVGLTSSGDVRVGPWLEVRGLREVVAGGQVVLTAVPRTMDMFWYRGKGILALRAGGNLERGTAQIAWGYLAPWNLFGTSRGASRYMIGARIVGSFTRAHADPEDWTATVGLEVEPIGALRYLLGIRSLY